MNTFETPGINRIKGPVKPELAQPVSLETYGLSDLEEIQRRIVATTEQHEANLAELKAKQLEAQEARAPLHRILQTRLALVNLIGHVQRTRAEHVKNASEYRTELLGALNDPNGGVNMVNITTMRFPNCVQSEFFTGVCNEWLEAKNKELAALNVQALDEAKAKNLVHLLPLEIAAK